MIDEKALRGEGFDEEMSVPVVMGDGQTWHLPKPVMRRRPVFNAGKTDSSRLVAADREFDAMVRGVEETDSLVAVANLAAYMLQKNYPGITDDQLGEVLEYDPADQSPERWPMAVMSVAYGRTGPKLGPAI